MFFSASAIMFRQVMGRALGTPATKLESAVGASVLTSVEHHPDLLPWFTRKDANEYCAALSARVVLLYLRILHLTCSPQLVR
jgi:hypothetical protein